MLTEALGRASCHYPHTADEKTEISKCPETCLPSTGFPMDSKTEPRERRLRRPPLISPTENLERRPVRTCTVHVGGSCVQVLFHKPCVGEGISPESACSCVWSPEGNADRAGMRARPLTSGFPAGSGPTDLPRPRTLSPGLVNGPRQILAAPQGETVILKVSESPRVHHSFCGDTSRFPDRLCRCSRCEIPMPVSAGLRAPPSGRRWA